MNTVSIEAVDKILAGLVRIIADDGARIRELEARLESMVEQAFITEATPDHSCEVLDRQVARLLKLCEGRCVTEVSSDWIVDNFITDPADRRS